LGDSVITNDTGDLWTYSYAGLDTGSIKFNNTTTMYVTSPSNQGFSFGLNDFTIEGWFRTSQSNATQSLLINAGSGVSLQLLSSNVFKFKFKDPVLFTEYSSQSATNSFSTNSWTHFAVMRNVGNASLFLNGVCKATMSGL
jgi:hypothetical protein